MIIVIESGFGYSNSNPEQVCLHFPHWGKVGIQLFSFRLSVNNWTDWLFYFVIATGLVEEKFWIQTNCRPEKGWAPPRLFLSNPCFKSSTPITKPGYEISLLILYINSVIQFYLDINYLNHLHFDQFANVSWY